MAIAGGRSFYSFAVRPATAYTDLGVGAWVLFDHRGREGNREFFHYRVHREGEPPARPYEVGTIWLVSIGRQPSSLFMHLCGPTYICLAQVPERVLASQRIDHEQRLARIERRWRHQQGSRPRD